MTSPLIREANARDAETLVEVYRSAYRENRVLGFPAKAETVTEEELTDWMTESRVFVAELEEQVIGSIRIDATSEDRLKISRLAVHEDWQDEGIGSALMDRVEELARDEGYVATWLSTPKAHPHLPSFYRDRGYLIVGDYPLPYREYDEVEMEKRLDATSEAESHR